MKKTEEERPRRERDSPVLLLFLFSVRQLFHSVGWCVEKKFKNVLHRNPTNNPFTRTSTSSPHVRPVTGGPARYQRCFFLPDDVSRSTHPTRRQISVALSLYVGVRWQQSGEDEEVVPLPCVDDSEHMQRRCPCRGFFRICFSTQRGRLSRLDLDMARRVDIHDHTCLEREEEIQLCPAARKKTITPVATDPNTRLASSSSSCFALETSALKILFITRSCCVF